MMKKMHRFLSMLIAVVMLLGMTAMMTTASAVRIVEEEATIYLDGQKQNVDAYVDEDGDICVYDVEELYRVLPDLEKEVFVLPGNDGYIVKEYIENFLDEYSYKESEDKLYIFTEDDEIIEIPVIEEKPIKLFKNGLYVEVARTFLSNENSSGYVYFVGFEDVMSIFREETANMYLPFRSEEETLLSDWCQRFGYKMYRIQECVFINNDGNIPVLIRKDGNRIEFPDQQPVIVNPGRTMIPVRSVAEATGASVSWDGDRNMVVVEKNNHRLLLWLGYQDYYLDGHYGKSDVKPYGLNGRTMVPIRLIAETMGFKVETTWEDGVFVINLSSGW